MPLVWAALHFQIRFPPNSTACTGVNAIRSTLAQSSPKHTGAEFLSLLQQQCIHMVHYSWESAEASRLGGED